MPQTSKPCFSATRHRKIILLLFAVVTAFFGYQLTRLQFGYEMEDFFDKDEKDNQFYSSFFEQFDNAMPNAAMIGIESKSKLGYVGLRNIDSFSNQVADLPEIAEAVSITNLQTVYLADDEPVTSNLLNLENEARFAASMQSLDSIPGQKKHFISENGRSTIIYLILEDSLELNALLQLKYSIDSMAGPHAFKANYFIDLDYNNYLIIEKIKKDSARLMFLALGLILIILIFFFRSAIGVIIPISIVVGTVIWIMGTIAFFGIKINVLTIAIPVIVSVICLSDVIHIISRYAEEKKGDIYAKIRLTQKDILRAILLTTLTTAVGFLSLATSNIPVFKEFGGFTALGVVYALILAYFVLPVLLFYGQNISVNKALNKITPKRVMVWPTTIVTLAIGIVCVLGVLRVHHNNYFYEDLNQDDEVGHVFSFMENEMTGLRDLTLAVTLKDSLASVFDKNVIEQLDKLERFVEKRYPATIDQGIASTVKQVNRSINSGYASEFKVPKDEEDFALVKSVLVKNAGLLKLRSIVARNKRATVIKTKTRDQGSYATFALNDSLYAYVQSNLPDLDVSVTGKAHIIDKTNVNVSEGMIWNLGIIVVFIFLLISFIFRSVFIGFFSLLPNVLPLVAITATVGWLDFGMNVATTIVYTIAFGIAVDDTIHFLARYKIERERGVENKQAVLNSIKTSGGAIILTTIILVAGFGVLITSHFYANYMTGLLVCIGMVMALLCDLFLLPVILSWMKEKR